MTERYPFYEKPPQTDADVREYLVSWLQPIDPPAVLDASWHQTFGFKRGFYIHGVFEGPDGVAFHVGEDGDMHNFPNFGVYASFDKMMDGVIRRYCELWKLPCV